jgi:signal transduction histidine kinase
VICERDGTILDWIYDELGLRQRLPPGSELEAIAAPFHWRKVNRFVRTIEGAEAALDWELSVTLAHGIVPLYFSGCPTGRRLFVLGTKEPLAAGEVPGIPGSASGRNARRAAAAAEELRHRSGGAAAGKRRLEREWPQLGRALPEAAAKGDRDTGCQELLESAVHDLRNPISGILAAAQYLLEEAGEILEPHQLTLLQSIESSARFMFLLLDEMVEQPEPARNTAPSGSADIATLIDHAVDMNRKLAEARHIRVEADCSAELPRVAADAVQLAGALERLVKSALRTSAPGGRVEVLARAQGDQVLITIRQADQDNPRRRPAGNGDLVALEQVRRVVEANRGDVQTEGGPRQPWNVLIRLPVLGRARKREPKKLERRARGGGCGGI